LTLPKLLEFNGLRLSFDQNPCISSSWSISWQQELSFCYHLLMSYGQSRIWELSLLTLRLEATHHQSFPSPCTDWAHHQSFFFSCHELPVLNLQYLLRFSFIMLSWLILLLSYYLLQLLMSVQEPKILVLGLLLKFILEVWFQWPLDLLNFKLGYCFQYWLRIEWLNFQSQL